MFAQELQKDIDEVDILGSGEEDEDLEADDQLDTALEKLSK